MTSFSRKIATGITTAALFGSLLAPAAFADITISGNGNNSASNVVDVSVSSTNLTQSNNQSVNLSVNSTANTGGNHANNNTGNGSVNITTGTATSNVTVDVVGSSNNATVCGCCKNTSNITVSLNGNDSLNDVTRTKIHTSLFSQGGSFGLSGSVLGRARTGRNRANNNTGTGGQTIKTGPSTSDVGVSVSGPANTLDQPCCTPTPTPSGV